MFTTCRRGDGAVRARRRQTEAVTHMGSHHLSRHTNSPQPPLAPRLANTGRLRQATALQHPAAAEHPARVGFTALRRRGKPITDAFLYHVQCTYVKAEPELFRAKNATDTLCYKEDEPLQQIRMRIHIIV